MPRTKIDPAVSRKAYAIAERNLKALNADQFALLLDEAYGSLGEDSPRVRREKAAEAEAHKRLLTAQKKEAAKARKIAEARALLEAAGLSVSDGDDDVIAEVFTSKGQVA
jgi:hypothetical protein